MGQFLFPGFGRDFGAVKLCEAPAFAGAGAGDFEAVRSGHERATTGADAGSRIWHNVLAEYNVRYGACVFRFVVEAVVDHSPGTSASFFRWLEKEDASS